MFFSGDPSGRKRVDLGGRSSKERDRQMVLEQARLERKRRLGLRQQNAAALKIQKCFRGRKAVAMAKSKVRMEFVEVYGGCCSKVDRSCFSPDSEFLRQLLFFFNTANFNDVSILTGVCQRLGELAKNNDIVSLFSGTNYGSNHAIADYRVKRLACSCLQAVHYNRDQIKKNILAEYNSNWEAPLMDTAVMLLNGNLPWTCNVVDFLIHKRVFSLLKDIIVSGMTSKRAFDARQVIPLERVIILLASHTAGDKCFCKNKDAAWKFSSEILSIPFLWKHFSCLKEVFATELLGRHQIHQMAIALSNDSFCIHDDASTKYPSNICLLGNLLETATVMLSQSCCAHDVVIDFAAVISHLLEMMPSSNEVSTINRDSDATDFDNEMLLDPKVMNVDADLQKQIFSAIDSSFLECLVNALFLDASLVNYSLSGGPSKKELSAVKAICHFLYVAFAVLPDDRIMTGLAYRTEIVLILWKFIKWCHETQQWPSFSLPTINWPEDVPGWLLPLAVFCPIYKHMLTIIDNEEFYDQEKPLSLNEIRSLVIILKQVLWELLWLTPATAGYPKSVSTSQRTTNNIKSRVHIAISELLNQLQDWNNRRPFLSSTDFHAPVGEIFVSQALTQNTKAHEILKHAPFLVPFTSRVKIFTSLLANARQSDAHHPAFIRHTVTIRRDHIFEDAFTKLRSLSADDLRGRIRISFINELGAEEAGVDGGGIFKDFLENILRETFSVQYGLFRETNSHLLYPNPASGLVHEQHLQYFHFLGTLLGKAMFEGILVDIPFATFFLSKLKHKRNYLNDLPSLDPELYRHLLFLKHYKGDVSELELYFVLVNNDYGEQKEEELLPGGKNIRVTKDNVITFIHLVAHYRLNFQIRLQSLHFLRGFQQLINTEWIDMFCEQEIQNLISGSSDSMDLQDLCSNAIYSGGYHEDHVVIKMFWDVVKSFSSEDQKKFLKFVTGCSRGPLLGFKYLEPKFCIQRAASLDATEEDLDRLPTSATCMNLLKLPPYKSLEQLRDKLVYAVSAEAGFDLS